MSDITIVTADDDKRTVHGWLVDDPPTLSGGYGGFRVADRPRKTGLTIWQGRAPFQLDVPMLLSDRGSSVSDEIHNLDVMSSGTSKGGPPTVKVDGAVPVPAHAGELWVIQDVQWGDIVRRSDRVVIRQRVNVTLLEYVSDATLEASTESSRTPGGNTVVRHYTVKKGDTLGSIAARQLGDQKRWVDVAAVNGFRSSNDLKPYIGRKIKLP